MASSARWDEFNDLPGLDEDAADVPGAPGKLTAQDVL